MLKDFRFGANMVGAFLLWDGLLIQLAKAFTSFHLHLITELRGELMNPVQHDSTEDPVKEAICEWMQHILTGKSWQILHEKELVRIQNESLKECFLDSSYWSLQLAESVLRVATAAQILEWKPLLDAAQATGSGNGPVQ
jgi:hypothetical protein